MTLTPEQGPSREQVIAWVDEQITRLKRNRASSPSGIDPRFTYEIACCEAILTLLQSAETVAQERDKLKWSFCHMDSNLTNTPRADITTDMVIQRAWAVFREIDDERMALKDERDRLTQEVERLKAHNDEAAVVLVRAGRERGETASALLKAEAEVTRLTTRWEALKAHETAITASAPVTEWAKGRTAHAIEVRDKMAELEATPSSPAEEG